MIEAIVDRDERWEQSLIGKEEWLNRPFQPPGLLRSGVFLETTAPCGVARGPQRPNLQALKSPSGHCSVRRQ